MRIHINAPDRTCDFDSKERESILFAGLRNGIELPYECATGTCGTCKARLIEGRLSDPWADAPGKKMLKADQGEFLMCQCVASGEVAVQVAMAIPAKAAGAAAAGPMTGLLTGLRHLTHDVAAFEVQLDTHCKFEAGQFVTIAALGVTGRRSYSMVNFESRAQHFEFVIKKKPGGGFSEWLFGGQAEGTRLEIFGPLGKATFEPGLAKNILCIAGGSGIAGMMSILARACQASYFGRHQGHVFFGVRTMRDAFYLDELSGYCELAGPGLSVTIALSDEDVPLEAPARHPRLRFERGLVHEVARRSMAGKFQDTRAYVAGPPPAVTAALRVLLVDGKLSPANIRYDKFS